VWLALKASLVAAVLVLAARRLPVLRPDRAADVSWAVVLPASVLQALVVSVLVLAGRL
jgi:NADH-quinone oxidoreductase subunit H